MISQKEAEDRGLNAARGCVNALGYFLIAVAAIGFGVMAFFGG